jgi:GTP-binding protein YchF
VGLTIGIIGLPNVGKSTVFNALTGAQNAVVANYPFCTIQPNRAIVPLPDPRVEKLAEMIGVPETIHATVEFVDIAGLVRGASKGEGLGNQFLGNIRDTDAILHIVRCFDDPNVVHVSDKSDPVSDIETINIELCLADIEQLERKIERLSGAAKGDQKLLPTLETARVLLGHLGQGYPVSSYPDQDNDQFKNLARELRFLTGKPFMYVANVDEGGLTAQNHCQEAARRVAEKHSAELIVLSAKLEADVLDLSAEERREYLLLSGVSESGLGQVIHRSFEILGLISFFTKNEREVRAWDIAQGSTAPQAAGKIHTDFERGFIRAEVASFDTYLEYGSDSAIKAAGKMRLEGRDYIVQDGDVIYFRFNV